MSRVIRLLCISCAHCTLGNSDSIVVRSDLISTSIWSTASDPYTNEKGVAPIKVLIVVRYPYKAYGSLSDQSR